MVEIEADAPYPLTFVEVALIGLEGEIEQVLDERLDLLDPITGEPSDGSGDAVLGVRLRYCLQYNPVDDTLEHWVEYPKSGQRVPRPHRELLHAIIVDRSEPLQLRVEGSFRSLAVSQDDQRLNETIDSFGSAIREATSELGESQAISDALTAMTAQGAAQALGVPKLRFLDGVGFTAEDGSISGLLRAIQPTLDLDDAGALPIGAHGSTAPSILAITESIAARSFEHRIVIIDDFGDSMDSAAVDFFARMLRKPSNQVWISTRRAEAVPAFEPEEMARLTRGLSGQMIHQLGVRPDRSERRRRRYLSQILAPALSARTVVFVEGPHDLEAYGALDNKMLREQRKVPLSAKGIQLLAASPTGADGGKSRLVDLAFMAKALGYSVRVVADSDKPGEDAELIAELTGLCDAVIVLPERTAVERAFVRGLRPETLRTALRELNEDYQLNIDADGVPEEELERNLTKQLKQKGGLHRALVALLPEGEYPAIAVEVLRALKSKAPVDKLVEIPEH